MRLLLASADDGTAEPILLGLRLRGHQVERATSGLIAFSLAADNPHDAILVDQTLPYLAGVDVVRHLRWRQVRQPIILLSAQGSDGYRRIAEEAGASALLIKPVAVSDIEAALTALRNPVGGLQQTLRRGDIQVDRGRRCAIRNGRTIPLTRAQTRLLWALAEKAGEVVSREDLYDSVFRFSSGDQTGTLTSLVAGLRKRLVAPGETDCIETVRGIGYRLAIAPTTDRRVRTDIQMPIPARTSLNI